MANKNMTRVQALEVALACVDNAEAREVLAHMVEQLQKPKAAAPSKSKTALENEASARHLYEVTPEGVAFDSAYVMQHTLAMTPQKVVGIMRVGITLGLFEKFKEGKRTVYRKL